MRKIAQIKGTAILGKNKQATIHGGSSLPCTQKGRICCDASGCSESYCTIYGCLID